MARQKKDTGKKKSNGGNLGFEEKLWQAADKMRPYGLCRIQTCSPRPYLS